MPAYAAAPIALVMPGHDLERHAGGGERLGLLAAAPEHERVAALEPHDASRRSGPARRAAALISSWVRSTWPGRLARR